MTDQRVGTGATKTYLLKGLDCPNCAAKIEKEVGELSGVNSASLNLIKQTLTVHTVGEIDLKAEIARIVRSHEPRVKVVAGGENKQKGAGKSATVMIYRLIVGAALFAVGLILSFIDGVPPAITLSALIAGYTVLGVDVLYKAVKNIVRGRVFDENFLMSIATVGALVIGEYPEAVAVMLLYQVGELFQSQAVKRSRRNIASLMDIRPDVANVIRGGDTAQVNPQDVGVGELILVKPGEKIALDGRVVSGKSALDTKALTGESVPREVGEGDEVLSGCINQTGALTVEVTKSYQNSTVAKIIDLVENASSRKAKAENFITIFARYYTPVVVVLAALLAVIPPLAFEASWQEWIHRALVFLVISCPCALVISIPLTFFGGIGAASRRGVLVKGSNYLEALNSLGVVVFDKTGTLTKGEFCVKEVLHSDGFSGQEALEIAATVESFSLHPIARSIVSEYGGVVDGNRVTEYHEISGYGVSAKLDGRQVLVGSASLMDESNVQRPLVEQAGAKVYVAVDGAYAGCILVADQVKPDSKGAIAQLKRQGIEVVMLTGDDQKIAGAVSAELDIDGYHAQLLPAQKVEQVEKLATSGKKVAFVGDGINDAPVLARADVGVAMGGLGSDAAIEAADVVLMTDQPSKLNEAIKVAKSTKKIVVQNIVFTLVVKAAFLVLGAFGISGMWEAVFGDVGVAVIAILNAMRMLKNKIE